MIQSTSRASARKKTIKQGPASLPVIPAQAGIQFRNRSRSEYPSEIEVLSCVSPHSTRRWFLGVAIAVLAVPLLSGCQINPRRASDACMRDSSIRALWVTRWDYKSPRDISIVMDNVARGGFNTVMFQVRGHGTSFYRSKLEPWADELGGRDPGYDPLAIATREAHERGLSIHAWVNVMPGWRGDKPPTNARQLYNAHPDWFWHDARGRREPLGWYNNLNPCLPEVRRYLVAVMKEIVAGYQIDGLHMDYVRFPNEWNKAYAKGTTVPDYPRDPRTLMLFKQDTGKTPEQSPNQWGRWRSEQVTHLVKDIRQMCKKTNPRVKLTAAVGAYPDRARRLHFQNVRAWLALGLLDAVFPMNYDKDMRTFQRRLDAWAGMGLRVPVVMGVNFDKRPPGLVRQQVRLARIAVKHFAAFAYNSLYERRDDHGRPINNEQSASRQALRQGVLPSLHRPVREPAIASRMP